MPHAPHIHAWYCTRSWERRRRHQLRIEPLCCLPRSPITLTQLRHELIYLPVTRYGKVIS